MSELEPAPKTITQKEAGRILGVHWHTIKQYLKRGTLKGYIPPGSRYERVRLDSLTKLATQGPILTSG